MIFVFCLSIAAFWIVFLFLCAQCFVQFEIEWGVCTKNVHFRVNNLIQSGSEQVSKSGSKCRLSVPAAWSTFRFFIWFQWQSTFYKKKKRGKKMVAVVYWYSSFSFPIWLFTWLFNKKVLYLWKSAREVESSKKYIPVSRKVLSKHSSFDCY